MGLLAESKSRRKISNDPNNTKWTRDTTTFGQKILRAQGWEPGQYLGAQNAPHSELHTAANASYIRVILKDDMKGLGFSRSKEDAVTGLDVFQDLLSRLNGKSEESVQADQQARLAVKTHHYVESRWGPMRFVRGGLLVGDELKELKIDDEEKDSSSDSESQEDSAEPMEVDPAPKESKKEKKSKKRKAVDEDESSDKDSDSKSKKRRKQERKSKDTEDSDDAKARKKEKKEKKSKKDKSSKKSAEVSEDEAAQSDERSKKRKSKKDKSRSPEDSEEDKAKKAKKEKKEKKKRRKEEAAASDSASTSVAPSAVASAAGTGTSTPTGTGTSTPLGSRNFVRSRFIAQKRQAVLDTKALNQIFMVKA